MTVSSDVTNVSITCTTNMYTVKVAVGGEQGSGLVLQDNGADDLPASVDGTYSFATQSSDGSAFAVTVLSQPANLTCTADPGGKISGADADLNVTCL